MKFIHVEVSDDLHKKSDHAAKANRNTVEEWVRNACLAEANYDIFRHQQREQRRHSGQVYTSGGPRESEPQWEKAVKT